MIDYSLILMAGLFSSVHCIGMCGPIVMAYSTYGSGDTEAGAESRAGNLLYIHLIYNSGRILSYMILGGVLGYTGTVLGEIKSLGRVLSVAGGSFIIIFGLAILFQFSFSTFFSHMSWFGRIRQIQGKLLNRRNLAGKFLLGIFTPLIPCGLLYAMLIKAISSGSAFNGALSMGIYGAGMALPLMLVGSLSSFISSGLKRTSYRISAVLLIVMGVILLLRGFNVHYLSWLPGGPMIHNCHGM